MISEEEFHEILKKKGMVERCRKIWWNQWEPYQIKFGGEKDLLENLIMAVTEKGCKAPCGL